LVHHGDEPLVLEALLDATEDERSIRSIGAEVALYKIGNDPDKRFARLLDILRTGKLDEEHVYLLNLDYEEISQENDLLYMWGTARAAVQHVGFLLGLNLIPSEDSHRISDLLELLESESQCVRTEAMHSLLIFRDEPAVWSALEDVAENDPSESMRVYAAQVLEIELPHHYSYEDYVEQNRRGFLISILLIAAMIVGSIVVVRRLPRVE